MVQEGVRFSVTSKNYYFNYKLALAAVLIGSILGGIKESVVAAFIGFLIGFTIVTIVFLAFRKHIGDYVEIAESQLNICNAGKVYHLPIDQIANIIGKRYNTTRWYEIYPKVGKKITISPSGYENGEELEKMILWFIEMNQIGDLRFIRNLK